MHTHKVLKNWEFHQDSVHSLFINPGFNKILSGSRNGEIYMTDLSRGCFCKIDKVNEPITSLAMNNNFDILACTSQSKIFEYVSNLRILKINHHYLQF
jgi:hypothetical protein